MQTIRTLLMILALGFGCVGLSQAAAVDINQADAIALSKAMKGVGLKKAQAIVAYRQQHGAFKSLEELAKVKGIGLKTVEKNRVNLTVKSKSGKLQAKAVKAR